MAAHDQEENVLLRADEGRIRTLTLNRPHRSNAIDPELGDRLVEEIVEAERDRDVWVLVITGAGTRAFCGGIDLKAMAERDRAGGQPVRPALPPTRHYTELLTQMETPVIAALNGHAVAGGLELALACDIRIASADATFGLPEAKRGLGAAFGSVVLPRLIPFGVALELLFTGDPVSADDALRLGLVNRVVPQAEVAATAAELATRIAANAPLSIRRMKANAWGTASLPLAAALRLELGPDPYASEDRVEGVRAWVEGRPPEWRNR